MLAADEQALAIDVFRLHTVGHPGEARRSLRLNPANDNARCVLRAEA